MRILHTADWHLGKKLDRVERLPEQVEVLDEICVIADEQSADVVLIAGDLFDHINPDNNALKLYYKTLKRLSKNGTRPVFAIAGNHDSPQRIENPMPLAEECGIIVIGFPETKVSTFKLETGVELIQSDAGFVELKLPKYDYPLRVIMTPYANELRLRKSLGTEDREEELRNILSENWKNTADKYCDNKGVNVLMTHLFVTKKGAKQEQEPDSEKPILHVGGAQAIFTKNFPKQMQYIALGHLHRKQVVDTQPCPIVYSSSILGYSFAEAKQPKYVMLADIEPAQEVVLTAIELKKGKKLLRERFETVDAAVKWLGENQNALVEITIATDTYLTRAEQNSINTAHSGIVSLIPEVKNPESMASNRETIDLSKDIQELFSEYFTSKKGVEPNEEILDLFKEVLAQKES